MKIKIYDDIHRLTLLHSISDLELDECVDFSDNPEAIFVRSMNLKGMDLPRSLIAIGRAGSGVDNIPLDWCNRNGVAVFNAPGANARAVTELVLGALVASARPIFQAAAALEKDSGNPEELKKRYKGNELAGSRIRVIGLGAVGSQVAKMCVNLGMEVLAYDPYAKNPDTFDGKIKILTKFEDLLAPDNWTRFITLHSSLSDDNREMIDQRFFSAGVSLINLARAELVNERDLLDDLQTSRVSSYISDFVPKKIPIGEFLKTGRSIFLPHLGASTYEAETRAVAIVGELVSNFFHYGICQGSVNFPEMPGEKASPGRLRFVVSNFDQPKIIEKVSCAIGVAGLNIGEMVNHSRKDTGLALNYIDVDMAEPDGRVLAAYEIIKEIEGVTRVRVCDPNSRY